MKCLRISVAAAILLLGCLAGSALISSRLATAQEKPSAKAKEAAKEKAPAPKPKTVPHREATHPLMGAINRLALPDHQYDLPDAVLSPDGTIFTAFLDWDGEDDTLRIASNDQSDWSDPQKPLVKGVLHAPAIALDGEETVHVIWPQTSLSDDTVDIFAATWDREDGLLDQTTIADTDAAEAFVDAGSDSQGRVWVVWQSFRAGEGDVYARCYDPAMGNWSSEIAVATERGGDWEPQLAFDSDGRAWVVWDSSRSHDTNEFNLYLACITLPSEPGAEPSVVKYPIAHTDRYEARASIAATSDGTGFWIAAEQGKSRWGLDSRGHDNGTGINAGKRVLFGRFDIASEAFTEIPLGPAGEAGNPVNVPVVGVDQEGNPVVAYRYFQRALWRIEVTTYRQDSGTWSARRRLEDSSYGQDRRLVFLPGSGDAAIRAIWPSDLRGTKA
ncbi:MAG: hypothetical protein AAF236_16635, partial [Verrucomicrobiota bacterium]